MSNWTVYPDAPSFLKACQGFLMKNEALNNMILSTATRYVQNPPKIAPLFASYGGAEIRGALVGGIDKPILITDLPPESSNGLPELLKDHPRVDVMGPEPAASVVARVIEKTRGLSLRTHGFHMHIWQKAPYVPLSSGQMRRAWIKDTEPLLKWTGDFVQSTGVPETPEDTAKLLQQMIVNRRLFVWADKGEVVCMAAFTGPTLNGVRINTVYTPAEKRKLGYARSLVLKLSELQNQMGKRFCVLFTDPANPTSNKIYREIGYQPLALFTHYFPPPAEPAADVPVPTGDAG